MVFCTSCSRHVYTRAAANVAFVRRAGLQNDPRLACRSYATETQPDKPFTLDSFYEQILPKNRNAVRVGVSAAAPPTGVLPKTERDQVIERARVVFGSRLAGPAERRAERDSASIRIAGVLVPPRPEEPDNCCMSGCVNCVWDRYRDELEEWAEKSAVARQRIKSQRRAEANEIERRSGGQRSKADAPMPSHVAHSMDDDGGGSEALWDELDLPGGTRDLFADIPVGIREFMRTEKMLKEKRVHELQTHG